MPTITHSSEWVPFTEIVPGDMIKVPYGSMKLWADLEAAETHDAPYRVVESVVGCLINGDHYVEITFEDSFRGRYPVDANVPRAVSYTSD